MASMSACGSESADSDAETPGEVTRAAAVATNGGEGATPPKASIHDEDATQGGRVPDAEDLPTVVRPAAGSTIPRSVVLCATGVPPGAPSPFSPQWVSFSDKMAAELEERPDGCEIGASDVELTKVDMGEDTDERARCGVGMRGTVASAYRWGYAGASATVVEKTLDDYARLELLTRGDGKLYRIEFVMKEQLLLQCGDDTFNPYGVTFRCGSGDDATIVSHDINLEGLEQQMAEGGVWGGKVPFDPAEVQRVQIRPVNAGGSQFGFDCKFRSHWLEKR